MAWQSIYALVMALYTHVFYILVISGNSYFPFLHSTGKGLQANLNPLAQLFHIPGGDG